MEYDEFFWEITRDNIAYELEKQAKEKGFYFRADDNIKIEGELRSYPSTSIGSYITEVEDFEAISMVIEIIPHTTVGYYEGFNLDWNLSIRFSDDETDGGDFQSVEDLICDIERYGSEYSQKNIDKIKKRVEEEIEKAVENVEEVFEMFSIPLKVFASFSNGETIYKEA